MLKNEEHAAVFTGVHVADFSEGDGLSWGACMLVVQGARLLLALLRGCLSTNKVHAGHAQPGELHLLSRGGGTLLQANISGRPEAAFQCQLSPDTVCSVLHTHLDQCWELL